MTKTLDHLNDVIVNLL